MSHLESTKETFNCPNCKTELIGQFCARCGQNQKGSDRFLFSLIAEAFEDVFAFDSRAAKTVFRLMFKPGALTKEYFRGRRARYVQPLRLYFITSLAFFFLLSVQNLVNETKINISDEKDLLVINAAGDNTEQALKNMDDLNEAEKKELDEGLNKLSNDLELNFLSEEKAAEFEKKLKAQIEKAIKLAKQNPNAILDEMLELAPPVIFCLLPIFAFLLKIVYINTGRYYTEHLILAVHNHSFIYLALLFVGIIDLIPTNGLSEIIKTLMLLWIPLYLFLSLKNTYEEGWPLTLIKYATLGVTYSMLFGFMSLLALVIGILSL